MSTMLALLGSLILMVLGAVAVASTNADLSGCLLFGLGMLLGVLGVIDGTVSRSGSKRAK